MRITKTLFCLALAIITVLAVCPVSANALSAMQSVPTGDNSAMLILSIVGIGVAALVVVILLVVGRKK